MRELFLACIGCLLVLVCGCSALDWVAGVDEEGKDLPGPAPLEVAGGAAQPLLPWAPGAAGALVALWAAVRGKRYKDALSVTVEGVEEFGKTPEGQAIISRLKSYLKNKHADKDVLATVRALVAKMGHSPKP